MRAAGIFSHLVLAFLCASLSALALPSSDSPAPAVSALSSPTAEPAQASPARVIDASQTVAVSPLLLEPITPVDPPATEIAPVNAEPAVLQPWAEAARPLERSATAATQESVAESVPPAPTPAVVPDPSTVVAAAVALPAAPSPVAEVAPVRVAAGSPAPVPAAPATPATGTPAVALAPPADPLADPHANGGTPGLKPAKALFGAVATPAPLAARAIGSYARGCLAGAQALPVDGETWQAMRLSRNRNWGHPKLIKLIEKLSIDGKQKDGWTGLLVGDIAQPRGGPMLTGHASHQIGLDADIWLTPMPDRRLTNKERETIEATSMLSDDGTTVNRDVWTEGHLNILKRAASYPDVERIFVHPAIKQVLCYAAKDDRSWLSKVRAYWGHHYHFHVRIHCPPGSGDCAPQASVPGDDGCGTELDDWLKRIANIKSEPAPLPLPTPPPIAAAKPKEKPPMTLDQLPQACSVVLAKDNPQLQSDIDAAAKAVEAAKAAKLAEAANKAAAKTAAKTAETAAGKTAAAPAAGAKSANARVDPNAAAAKALALPAPAAAKPATVEKKSASQ